MAVSKTSFSKSNQPKKQAIRGRSKKTVILDSIKESSLKSVKKNSSNDVAERAFFGHIAAIAFDPEDKDRGMCIKLLTDKGWGSVKPSAECVTFDFDESATVHEQAMQIIKAASQGVIPPDIANTLITSMAAMLKIQEVTDLEDRIKAIEDASEQD